MSTTEISNRINKDFKQHIERQFRVKLRQQNLDWKFYGEYKDCLGAIEEFQGIAE